MKNTIRIIAALLIVFAMGLALICCSNNESADTKADAETTAAADTTEETKEETEEQTEEATETEAEIGMPYACVTVYDGAKVVAAEVKVEKVDEDEDGKWTINDALITLHKDKCADGFATVTSDYGPMITKLWAVENGGAYGYYKNNRMSMGLTEELSETEPDHVYAYVYSDATGYSDAYSFFDKYAVSGKEGDKVTLSVKYIAGFDENYVPIESPLADAVITIDGNATEFKTDENGSVEITLPASGTVISAAKEGLTLIPPVCVIE